MNAIGNPAVASSTPFRVRREVELPAPPKRVWAALTAEISEWFGADVELDPSPGGLARFRWPDGWERGAVIEEALAPSTLIFRWLPFERSAAGDVRAARPGRVELRLESAGDGTRLSVTEIDPRGGLLVARGA